MPAEPERFADLFREASVEGMYALSPREFEHFVGYLLQRAGYEVNEVHPHFLCGVKYELTPPGKTRVFGGVECKRLAPDKRVTSVGMDAYPFVRRRIVYPLRSAGPTRP